MSIQYTADQLQRKFRGPPGAPGFQRVADVLRGEGKLDEAIQMCQDGLRVRPNTLSAYVVLGKALMDAERMEDAREQFEAALRLDPRCLSAMHFLARIMTKLQWADAAAGYYRSILEVEPWDKEIRALLGETAPRPGSPMAAPAAPEETFAKPEGFAGDVLEVNLNDMAADFLPGRDDETSASLGLAEESLEDALSQDAFAAPNEEARKSPVPDPLAEPKPLDLLKEEPIAPMDEIVEDAPPISGQDVEERLDSLFGSEDAPPASMHSSSATWTPAPAEAEEPEAPAPIDFSPSEAPGTDASATAMDEIPASETGEMRAKSADDFSHQTASTSQEDISPLDLASVPDLPEADADGAAAATAMGDYSAVEFVTPPPAAAREDAAGAETDGDARVQGEDIERRLDELFNLSEEDDRPPAPATVSAMLPVAPDPKVEEPVSMGETVSFGGEVVFREPDEDVITGQDVADKLDSLFGEEPAAPAIAAAGSAETQGMEASGIAGLEETQYGAKTGAMPAEPPVSEFPELKPWAKDDGSAQPPPAGDVMSTESMLPPGWFGEAGDGPSITGADVEAQLDKLFHIEEDGETVRPKGLRPGSDAVNTGDTATFRVPGADDARPQAPGDESDRTVIMPAMGDPSLREARLPKDAGRIKESVTEWLARQNEEADERAAASLKFVPESKLAAPVQGNDAADTMILPNEDLAGLGEDEDSFGTLAPEDLATLSETSSIEMVDGTDVAERLDALFAEEGAAATPPHSRDSSTPDASSHASSSDASSSESEMSLFVEETGEGPIMAAIEHALPTETGVPTGLDTEEELSPNTGMDKAAGQAAPLLAPMMDEEEGYPEEEEMAAGTGAGANVATVTLAEIYFQQGLREQALQIYRQLLEREPENESVRKRIEEIESAKPEGGAGGSGSDPRRPRPGLKVPKRKK